MPTGGTILDVGNGLGAQDPVIAQVARPRRLVAVNITASQLAVGREWLARAGALAVRADAVLLPVADTSVDGVICVEAAFHFSSRARFFNEAFRVLRPGGVLALSDVPILRLPGGPRELLAGIAQLRVWGIRASGVVNAKGLEGLVRQAGFVDVRAERCGSRVIDPAIRLTRRRLATADLPWLQRSAARVAVGQVERLRRNGILEYVLLWARKPGGEGGSMG
jgi:SAM-dependent methyltransferase